MLSDTLRNGAQSKLFKTVLGLIIISFIFTGVGGYLIPSLDTNPVEVGEFKISANDWNHRYNNETRRLMQYNPEAAELLEDKEYVTDLRRAVLEEMVSQAAVTSVAYDSGIRVGNDQVRDVIANTEAFYKDGKFDNDLYLASIRSMGYTPDFFGEQVRADQSTHIMTSPLMKAYIKPLENEIKLFYMLIAEQRRVDMYKMKKDAFAEKMEVSEEDASKFYEQNKNTLFMEPAEVRFHYVLLTAQEVMEGLKPTDEELQKYYDLNSSKYTDSKGKVQEFKDAREKVKAEYLGEKSRQEFNDRVTTLNDISFENPDSLDDAARAVSLEVRDSGLVKSGDESLQWPLNLPSVQKLAFSEESISSNMNTKVLEIDDDSVIVLNVYEHHESTEKPFEEVQEQVRALVRTQKSQVEVSMELENLAERLMHGEPIDTEAFEIQSNLDIPRGSDVVTPELGVAIFSIVNDGGFNYTIQEDGDNMVLAVLRSVTHDIGSYEQYKAFIKNQWLQTQQAVIENMIYKGAREMVDIKYNEDAISLINQNNEEQL